MEPAELAAFAASLPPPAAAADSAAGRTAGHIRNLAGEVARELLRLLPAGGAADALALLAGMVAACDAALDPRPAADDAEGSPGE